MENFDVVVVVGAGPAGLIAAGRAGELGAKVLLLEKMKKEGKKLLITGKGRCNITNESYKSNYFKRIYPNGKFLKYAFSQFFTKEIVELLNNNGVETVVERGDRVFPKSNMAADVLSALLLYAKNNNVVTRRNCNVTKLLIENEKIKAVEYRFNNEKRVVNTKSVILCNGGKSYPATGSTGDGYKLAQAVGHKIETVRPALVPLETKGDMANKLMGVSLKNSNVVVWVNDKKQKEEFGELLFTHFGLSGPTVLTLSRFVVDELINKNKVEISIDLKPALNEQKLDNRLIRDLNDNGKKQIENIFKLWLPSKMIPIFLEAAKIDPVKVGHQINAKERGEIKNLMKNLKFEISGYRSFKEAIITAGGISTQEIDSKTMESKIIKNLHFAGEIIDLDGETGGYNLQIAYSTAWIAGNACGDN
ncbi:MAG: NAD(P)/FAD-dependent oxidoreductase [Bacteroidales bacterium]|nr:NAD(P)/FAD-dependent oxidoreductase [Bacteroidales bacterium]